MVSYRVLEEIDFVDVVSLFLRFALNGYRLYMNRISSSKYVINLCPRLKKKYIYINKRVNKL